MEQEQHPRIGDIINFSIAGVDPQEKARIIALTETNRATIRVLTGPLRGMEVEDAHLYVYAQLATGKQ
jgi:hypothetical protein